MSTLRVRQLGLDLYSTASRKLTLFQSDNVSFLLWFKLPAKEFICEWNWKHTLLVSIILSVQLSKVNLSPEFRTTFHTIKKRYADSWMQWIFGENNVMWQTSLNIIEHYLDNLHEKIHCKCTRIIFEQCNFRCDKNREMAEIGQIFTDLYRRPLFTCIITTISISMLLRRKINSIRMRDVINSGLVSQVDMT